MHCSCYSNPVAGTVAATVTRLLLLLLLLDTAHCCFYVAGLAAGDAACFALLESSLLCFTGEQLAALVAGQQLAALAARRWIATCYGAVEGGQ